MQKKLPTIYYFVSDINLADLSKLSNNINIIYRNYKKKIRIKDLLKLKKKCKTSKRQLFISNDIKIALKYNLNGIYILHLIEKLIIYPHFLYLKTSK